MKTTESTFVVLSLVLLTTGALRAMENREDISGTTKASCLVQVTSDPAIFPVNWQTIEALVYSSGVGGKAAREVLKISPDDISEIFTIDILGSGGGMGTTGLGPRPTTTSRLGKPGLGEDAGMDGYEMMMEEYGMKGGDEYSPFAPSSRTTRGRTSSTATSSSRSRSSSYGRSTTTARKPGETTAQYEARRRAQAAARARDAAARSRTRRSTATTGIISAVGQTTLLRLSVGLPDEAAPAAKEFVSALVENLHHVLLDAYDAYASELQSQFTFAERQRDTAEARLADATSQVEAVKVTPPLEPDPVDVAVREQLETIVDLSNLSQAMSFEEVVQVLEDSVDPPLQMQPNWKNLLEFADLEPTTPAMMDPLTGIKLRKGLELLLAGVSSDLVKVGYVVDEGVIVIATEDRLPSKLVTVVYQTSGLDCAALVQTIQDTIEPDSWHDSSKGPSRNLVTHSSQGLRNPTQVLQIETSRTGKGKVVSYAASKLVVLQTHEVHEEIEKFLVSMTKNIPATVRSQIPPEMLLSEKRDLLREKQIIEMETVRLQARQLGIESQIAKIKNQMEANVKPDPVIAELEQLVEMHAAQLALLERQYQAGRLEGTELVDVKEKLTRAKIDLAKRRQQVSLPGGGVQVGKYNNDLADITIELAEKAAALRVLNEQLGQTEHQLTAATMIDPQVSKIRMATRAFEMADERVNELNARIVNLRPPTVSVLGGK
ncbi:MAG: hypothetical protein ACYSWQ_18490 [Planctomycetota bacterium]